VPLSEHEQQLLEQMEQALYAEDPKFASHMKGDRSAAAARRRYIIGGVGTVAGLALVLVGVTASNLWVGALGFALMVASVVYAVTPPRRRASIGAVKADGSVGQPPRARARGRSSRSARSGTFMQRLEERWERRRHDW
jgi:hypothetical protein